MIRVNVSEEIDGVNYRAETDDIDGAREFLKFLGSLRTTPWTPQTAGLPLQSGNAATVLLSAPEPTSLVGAGYVENPAGDAQKWTRENLQPVVIGLAKQRDKFVALLQQFGVARFRDLPDDKLHEFGVACQGVV